MILQLVFLMTIPSCLTYRNLEILKDLPRKNMCRSYLNFNLDFFNEALKLQSDSIRHNDLYTLFEKKILFLSKQEPLKALNATGTVTTSSYLWN